MYVGYRSRFCDICDRVIDLDEWNNMAMDMKLRLKIGTRCPRYFSDSSVVASTDGCLPT